MLNRLLSFKNVIPGSIIQKKQFHVIQDSRNYMLQKLEIEFTFRHMLWTYLHFNIKVSQR
jgi:hypothetical protein